MRIVALIPSRLKSSRLENKALLDIHGLPMVVHVYRRALLSPVVEDVWVATDSRKILEAVEQHGGKALMTSESHLNGTERLAEAAEQIECDYVVLVNGDEALLNPEYIEVSVNALLESGADASILVNKFTRTDSPSDFKVVLNLAGDVMYISRGDIPCDARNPVSYRLKAYHLMTFKKEFLSVYAALEPSPMERIEDHEHLRIIENGYRIRAAMVDSTAVSVDTPADLDYVRDMMAEDRFFIQYR